MEAIKSALMWGAESISLTFFGGDPLLKTSLLFEILKEARTLERITGVPFTAKVSTNGILLDENTLALAARWGLFISLSMDGIKEAHDLGRRDVKGECRYEQTMKALKLLVAAGRPFAVYSVITPDNVKYLARSIEFLWNEGARIIMNTMDYTGDWTERALVCLGRQYRRAGKFYQRLLEKGKYFHLEPFDSRIPMRTRAGEWKRCRPGVSQVVVAPDGTLYGCLEYFYRRLSPLGTTRSWLDPGRVKTLARDKRENLTECRACALRSRCNNRCSCINLRGTGTAGRPPESLCLCERETLFSMDEVAARIYRKKIPEFILRNYSCSYHLLTGIEGLLKEMENQYEPAQTG
jgi:uncharacterized protein